MVKLALAVWGVLSLTGLRVGGARLELLLPVSVGNYAECEVP
jgi:hypothetical protein